jgi:hypothetical protein
MTHWSPTSLYRLAGLLLLTVGLSSANTIIFITPANSKDSMLDPVSASAVVTTFNGGVAVTLNNLQANPKDAGELLSSFNFTLATGPTTALNGSTMPSGSLIDISDSNVATPDNGALLSWALTSSGHVVTLNSLVGGPSETVIGPGPYTNANSSIAKTGGPHNPFLSQSATFFFSVSGVTSTTAITAASFGFGTASGDNITANIQPAPEPASMFLIGGGLLGIALIRRSRRA